jgi:DNA-binding CsgD family transcriptional regulator
LIQCDAIEVVEVDSSGYVVTPRAATADPAATVVSHLCTAPAASPPQRVAVSPRGPDTLLDPTSLVTDTLRAGFGLPGSRTTVQLFLDRRHGAFSDRDVAMLRMLHPALDHAILMQRATATRTTELSGAERRVLDLVAEGRTNQEVANRLCVTVATVRKHLQHTYSKLGVRTRTAAVAAISGGRPRWEEVSAKTREKANTHAGSPR